MSSCTVINEHAAEKAHPSYLISALEINEMSEPM